RATEFFQSGALRFPESFSRAIEKAGVGKCRRDSGSGLAVETSEFVERFAFEERHVVDPKDAFEFVDRVGMVVDPNIDPAVVAAVVATLGFDDIERRTLLATCVAAGLVAGMQRRDE